MFIMMPSFDRRIRLSSGVTGLRLLPRTVAKAAVDRLVIPMPVLHPIYRF